MSVPKSILIIIALGLVLGCASKPPLPEDELPNDFLFVFTHERLTKFDETIELTADGEVVHETDEAESTGEDDPERPEVKIAPPPEGAEGTEPGMGGEDAEGTEPGMGEEDAGGTEPGMGEEDAEGTEPGMGEEDAEGTEPGMGGEDAEAGKTDGMESGEETVTLPLPSFVKVTVDVIGRTDIEVTHTLPRKNTSRQTLTLSKEDLMELYQLIRAADIYNLPGEFEDGDWEKGKETYAVIGRNKPKTVTVTGTQVEELARIRDRLLEMLPVRDLLTLPAMIERLVIMDRRTGVFYRSGEAAVKEIPEQYRKEYKDPWRALDDGGFPSPSFGPLPKEWD